MKLSDAAVTLDGVYEMPCADMLRDYCADEEPLYEAKLRLLVTKLHALKASPRHLTSCNSVQ